MEKSIWYEVYFDILNHLGVTHKCDRQIEGRTNIKIANAVLDYVARPKVLAATIVLVAEKCCTVLVQYNITVQKLYYKVATIAAIAQYCTTRLLIATNASIAVLSHSAIKDDSVSQQKSGKFDPAPPNP